ncbi:DUF4265 domain-containing protein [Actinoplanes sp. CA-131856]
MSSSPPGPSAAAVHAAFARFGLGSQAFSAEPPFAAFDVPADADFAGIKQALVEFRNALGAKQRVS